MSDKKEKLPYEKALEDITKKANVLDSYIKILSFRTEDVIFNTKEKLIKEKGLDYLKTEEGHQEYGHLGAKRAQELVLEEFDLNKNNFNEEELSDIVKIMYKTNQKTLTDFAREYGPEVNHDKFTKNYLNKHLMNLQQSALSQHITKYDSSHNPAILDHICEGKHTDYFKTELLDEIKNDRLKGHVMDAIITWNNGGKPLGLDYFRNSDTWSLYLKEEHKVNKHDLPTQLYNKGS